MTALAPEATAEATGTEVRRWVAGRLGIDPRVVIITREVADGFNRTHPERPYLGPVKPNTYRPIRGYRL